MNPTPCSRARLAGLVLAGLVWLTPGGGARAYDGPVIDAHFHTDTGRFLTRERIDGELVTLKPKPRAELIREALAAMRKYNVVYAVTSGPDPKVVAEWRAAEPDRFIPALQITNARLDKGYLGMLRRLAGSREMRVLGEIALQYEGFAPDHPAYDVYFELAESLKLPMALHLGPGPEQVFSVRPRYRVRLGDPLALEEVLRRHPRLKLQVMHAGWPFIDNMIAILNTYPQVYVGVGFLDWSLPKAEFDHTLKRLVDAGFDKRILYGSDPHPGAITRIIAMSIERIASAPYLSEAQKADILYNNAARFFDLPITR